MEVLGESIDSAIDVGVEAGRAGSRCEGGKGGGAPENWAVHGCLPLVEVNPTDLKGNNVQVADEMTGLTETALRQQLLRRIGARSWESVVAALSQALATVTTADARAFFAAAKRLFASASVVATGFSQ